MRHLRKAGFTFAIALAIASPAAPQTPPVDPEDTVVADVVVVAPADGPAWWKVSNGDTVVWIVGLPDVVVVDSTEWDTRVFQRRIRGAKAFLATPRRQVEFPYPTEIVDIPRRARLAIAAAENGFNASNYWPASFGAVLKLRHSFKSKHRILLDVETQMIRLARRSGVPVERRDYPMITFTEADLGLGDPEIMRCLDAMLEEIETPPAAYKANAENWANGRAFDFLAGPRGAWPTCMNRLMPGTSVSMIEEQTAAIARALNTPGKAVAAAPIRLLVAENGIIQRLRAQGFTIADPAKPLEE